MSKHNPFKPGYPADVKNFQGRDDFVEYYSNYLGQVIRGSMENFLVIGERGMGKSSFGKYLKNHAMTEYEMISIHIYNDRINDVESLIRLIIENLLEESKNKSWGQKIWNIFENHVESVNLFGVNIKLKTEPQDLAFIKNITGNFANFLIELTQNMGNKKGIFIIIDNIDGLCETSEFVNWYKSLIETLSSFPSSKPLAIMILASPDKLYKLESHNPSFSRIFHQKKLGALKDDEVKNFFIKSFEEIGVGIDNDALDLMVRFTSGQPTMMHEIGDAIFWTNKHKIISKSDALNGIFRACDEIGVKYLQLSLDNPIKNKKYLSIFKKIGEYFYYSHYNRFMEYKFDDDMIRILNDDEKSVFADFFITQMELDFLKFDGEDNHQVNTFLSSLSSDQKKIFGFLIMREQYIFNKNDLLPGLDKIEKEVYNDFLIKAKSSGILDLSYVNEIGRYRFTNNLFPLYCIIKYMESIMLI